MLRASIWVLWSLALGKTLTPRLKWGQNKEQLFISIIVRDLDVSSVSVEVSRDDLHFSAKSTAGEENVLQLPFRDDVKQEGVKWEIAARPDKWGTATMITLGKGHPHRWDVLTSESKSFKGLIDKDWTREDANLEAEEVSVLEDAEQVLRLTEKNFNRTLAAHPRLIVAARFPWCKDCKSSDQIFLKASSAAKVRGRKSKEWKKVAFAYLDARENKGLGRRFNVGCDITVAKNCDYLVFSGAPHEEPVRLGSQYDEAKFMSLIEKFLGPAVHELSSEEEIMKFKASNVTAIGYFASKDQQEYGFFLRAANQMRGEMAFGVHFKATRPRVELWVQHSEQPLISDANSSLETWLRRRSLPLLQDYEWSKRDAYERLQLPVAKVWYDDKDEDELLNAKVNSTMISMAKKMLGRMAFVKQKKSMYSYELRDYGLAHPEEFPAFGVAENVSWNSRKFGFEAGTAAKDFWSDANESKLLEFCEKVLAGEVEESHESGPLHSNWSIGEVKKIVWKSYIELKKPKLNLLLEIYGKFRSGHDVKLKEAENLARVLEPLDVTVGGYDTAENYLPAEDFQREKYASHSEWYWIPVGGAPVKLSKPKKDAPVKKVLQFLASQAALKVSVREIFQKWELAMKENPPAEPAEGPPDDGDMMAEAQVEL